MSACIYKVAAQANVEKHRLEQKQRAARRAANAAGPSYLHPLVTLV